VAAVKLTPRRVPKPWGRHDLPFGLDGSNGGEPIGEIIFDAPDGREDELLVKLLFTSERLSIQVPPDDHAAAERGLPRGKDEAWVVVDADPAATIGLGLHRPLAPEALRDAALDGSIEDVVDWRSVNTGDCFYSPAGAIHAIGPGLALVEVQQNADVTYRLYDYGRPRELHLADAVAVAKTDLSPPAQAPVPIAPGRDRLAGGPAFQVEQLTGPAEGTLPPPPDGLWAMLLDGEGSLAGNALEAGAAWRLTDACQVDLVGSARLLIAYPGARTEPVWQA